MIDIQRPKFLGTSVPLIALIALVGETIDLRISRMGIDRRKILTDNPSMRIVSSPGYIIVHGTCNK